MKSVAVYFRKLQNNHYSISKLMGLLDEYLPAGYVDIHQWRSFSDLKDIIAHSKNERRVFAYSFMTNALETVKNELEILSKKITRGDWIIAGGPHPTADPQGCLKIGFHRVFSGESERTIVRFFRDVIDGYLPDGQDVIYDTEGKPINLDDYTPFDYKRGFFVPIELTRGCTNKCTFCQAHSVHCGILRFRSLEGLRQPFAELQKKNRRKVFFITSNVLSYSPEGVGSRLEALHKLGQMALSYGLTDLHLGSFPSEVRPEYLKEEYLSVFKTYCRNRNIVIGAQTGSDRLLESIQRGHTVYDVKYAAQLARSCGFKPFVDIIFGLPGETLADRKETVDFIQWLLRYTGSRIHLHHFLPLPGTELWGCEPSAIDVGTRNYIDHLLRHGRAFGDIWRQEECSQQILSWRTQGLITI